MKTSHKTLIFTLFLALAINAQDSLHFQWEAGVWLPGRGQKTVVVDDTTMYHLGGQVPYGQLFDDPWHSFVERYSLNQGYWSVTNIKLLYREYINAHYFNGKIYVLGGSGWPASYAEVEIIDVVTGEVTIGEPLPKPGEQASSVLYDGKIYIWGGLYKNSDTGERLYRASLSIYDIAQNSWTQGADFPIEMATYGNAVAKNGKIYSFGGYDGTTHNEIYEYNIATNNWTFIGSTPEPISTHSNVIYGDNVFLIGAYDVENRFWKYNLADKSWTVYKSNFIGTRHASAVIFGDRLYTLAGVAQNNGKYRYSNVVQSLGLSEFPTSVATTPNQPNRFNLEQNYPNPFNPTTKILFDIQEQSNVTLKIFNSLGEVVTTLINKQLGPGKHEFNFNANNFSSGVYFYELNVNGKWQQTKKMTLVK